MLDWERYPSSYALAVLAQEEYAKALLLGLADAGAITCSADVMRALRDHVCKQLLTIILDYLSPDLEEFMRRYHFPRIGEPTPIFPPDVLDAIHVICHERIPRERDRWWVDPSDRPLDPKVREVADGGLDRRKQDAVYMGIGKTGDVYSLPSQMCEDDALAEVNRSERIGHRLRHLVQSGQPLNDLDSRKLIAMFQLLTGRLSPEEFNESLWLK